MRLILILSALVGLNAHASSPVCKINDYLISPEGQEKLRDLVERSKTLILSKLEEFSIGEQQILITTQLPKKENAFKTDLTIQIKVKNLEARGAYFSLSKIMKRDTCGLEIILFGGRLINRENRKDFGSLGRVKETVRLN